VLALSEVLGAGIDQRAQRLRAEANAEFFITVLSLIGALAACLVSALAIQRRILRPLLELERAANAISAGDLQHVARVTGNDEFGRLATAFEHMRRSLLAAAQERETTTQEMRKLSTAIENSVSSVIITDDRGVIEYVNPQFTL